MPPVAQFNLPKSGSNNQQNGSTQTSGGMPQVAQFSLPNSNNTSSSGGGNIFKNIGNFLFPAVGDIYHDIKGDSTKTPLQQVGDVALTALPFIPGLGELGEGARGAEAAVEGGEAVAKSGLLGKIIGSHIGSGAIMGYGAGVANNLSQGQGIGQAISPNLSNIGSAVIGGATGGLLHGVGGTTGSEIQKSAEDDISKVLSPTTKVNKQIVQEIAPRLAGEGIISSSRQGLLEKYGAKVEEAATNLEAEYQKLPPDAKVEVTGLFQTLNKKVDDLTVNGKVPSSAQPRVDAINKMMGDLANIGVETSPDGQKVFADVGNVRSLRQILDDNIVQGKKNFSPSELDGAKLSAQKTLANSIRSEFGKQYPDIAKINKDFSFWSKAQKVLSDSIERKTGQSGLLRKGIAEGVGAMGGLSQGHPIIGAAIMRTISDFIDSAAFHTTSAAVKSKIADAIGSSDYPLLQKLINSVPAGAIRTYQGLINLK